MTIQSQKVVDSVSTWTSTWLTISEKVATRFRMTNEELEELRGHTISKLIASIPFLAGCENPERTAISNLAVYMMSVGATKDAFCATPADDADVFARLRMARYEGGDPAVIRRGMSLIALNMITDYQRDVEDDLAAGKYNPIANGTWDFQQLHDELLDNVLTIDCPQMDEIATVEEVKNGWWGYGSGGGWLF